jgi:hypothetical protein
VKVRRWLGAPLGLLGIFLAGCDPRVEWGEVEGTVRHQGKPLANVLVAFVPDPDQGGTGVRAVGQTDEQGRYRLRDEGGRAGAPVGWYRVVLEDLAAYAVPRETDGTLTRKPPVRFPARFGDLLKTPLRRQVQPGAQTVDLDLSNVS